MSDLELFAKIGEKFIERFNNAEMAARFLAGQPVKVVSDKNAFFTTLGQGPVLPLKIGDTEANILAKIYRMLLVDYKKTKEDQKKEQRFFKESKKLKEKRNFELMGIISGDKNVSAKYGLGKGGLLALGAAGLLFSPDVMASLSGIENEFDNLWKNIKDIGTDIAITVKETIRPVDTTTLLETIASGESNIGERGYDVTYAHGALDPDWARGKRLSEMTVGEVERLQRDMLKHPGNIANTSAVGKYQITKTTLFGRNGTAERPEKGSIAEELSLKPEEKFSKETQERIGVQLLKRRGLEEYQKGEITEQQFQENLAKEWASIPTPRTGKSFYEGQKSHIPQEKIQNAIRKERTDTISAPVKREETIKEKTESSWQPPKVQLNPSTKQQIENKMKDFETEQNIPQPLSRLQNTQPKQTVAIINTIRNNQSTINMLSSDVHAPDRSALYQRMFG